MWLTSGYNLHGTKNGVLKAGRTYSFTFSPYEGGDWRIIKTLSWSYET